MPKTPMDDEMKAFAADVLESIAQARRGDVARLHTPADIATYKARGRIKEETNQQGTAPTCWRHSVPLAQAGKPA